ncbi:hypothetical protein Ptr902_11031 [Pyrenophora tritici-repentis]|nr:hypothetical protein Ptr902_11031 [Pyrenophora tritici-repentis]
MPILQILTFTLPSPSEAEASAHTALSSLKNAKAPENFVLGTRTSDKSALQLTSEWHDPAAEFTPEATSYRQTVLSTLGTPKSLFHVSLSGSSAVSAFASGSEGPMASPLVEYVQIYFPSGMVDEAFQEKIESEFRQFNEICMKVVRGNGGLRYGWVMEEQEHEGIEGVF